MTEREKSYINELEIALADAVLKRDVAMEYNQELSWQYYQGRVSGLEFALGNIRKATEGVE